MSNGDLQMTEPSIPQTASGCPGEFYYKGLPLSGFLTNSEVLDSLSSFPVEDDDVFVAAYPKSGANWTLTIVSAILQANQLETFSTNGMEGIPRGAFEFGHIQAAAPGARRPRVFHTHVTPGILPDALRSQKGKVIHVMRNPKDAAVSYYHFHRMNKAFGFYKGSWEEFFPFFNTGNVMYGKWDDFVTAWINESKGMNIKHMKYEDMVTNPHKSVKAIADFLGRPVTEEQVDVIVRETSFQQMKKSPQFTLEQVPEFDQKISPFLRKGKIGDWKNTFSKEQEKKVHGMYRNFVRKTGYSLQFEPKVEKWSGLCSCFGKSKVQPE